MKNKNQEDFRQEIFITVYTKEDGKQELTKDQWLKLNIEHLNFHRIDGPAKQWADGFEHWYIDGLLHREDNKPAISGKYEKRWYWHGMRHREYGPAVIRFNGEKMYYLNDIRINMEEK